MDQQLDKYQERITSSWLRLKNLVLNQFSHKQKMLMFFCLALVSFSAVNQFIYDFSFVLFTIEVSETILFSISSLMFSVISALGIIGSILMLFLRRLGWVFLMTFVMSRVLLLLMDLFWQIESYRVVISNPQISLSSNFNNELLTTVSFVLVSIFILAYFLSKQVIRIYKVRNKDIWISFIVMFLVMLFEIFISLSSG